ncbi:MAG: hypothetical protein JW803_05645 [Endomicrobiales bacterium]|nr:hypothetical protein [Endomicrobiales bacterium]
MKKTIVILIHALIGWALCGSVISVGRQMTSAWNALVVHLLLAPVFFAIVSQVYFKFFNYTKPFFTACVFTLFVISMDFFVVAMLIEKSYDMFLSPISTWVPFGLILLSTFTVGKLNEG